MFLLILAYVLIFTGFFLFYKRKKDKKNDESLKVARVTKIVKNEDNYYDLTIRYCLDNGMNFETKIIQAHHKHYIDEDIIIKQLPDGEIELYDGNKKMVLIYVGCWIIVIIILCFIK